MGQVINYKCNSCDFKFKEENKEFYVNEDLTEFKEEMCLFLTFKEIAKSPINGLVHITYCDNCDMFIKTYTITKNETKLTEKEVEDLILKSSKDTEFLGKKLEKLVLLNYDRENERYINCPECGKDLLKTLTHKSNCPNCENGKILAFGFECVD